MDSKFKGIFRRDIALLGFFTVCMWAVVLYVLSQVIGVVPGTTAKLIVGGSCFILIAFATSAMMAVYMHLKRNGAQLYEEEMSCQAGVN